MKIVRVYFKINNFDKIHIFWNIAPTDGEVKSGTEIITLPYVDLPYIQNAHYSVLYNAENEYGRTGTYTYEFDIATEEEYITTVNVEVSNTKESATISWNKVKDVNDYILHIYHDGTDSTITVHDTQFIYQPSEEGNYSFAVEVNGVISEPTDSYHLYIKPIFGTGSQPEAPTNLNVVGTYDSALRKAKITITFNHSSSEDVAGTYITITKASSDKEIYYLPAPSAGASDSIVKEYNILDDTTFDVEIYSVNVDGIASNTVSTSTTVDITTDTPPTPSTFNVDSSYNENLQKPIIDVSFDPITWDLPVEYEIAYTPTPTLTDWQYFRTTETRLIIVMDYGGFNAKVKVRARDTQGRTSDWISKDVSVTSDSSAPDAPTGLKAIGAFQTIWLTWFPNTEADLDHYIVEYDTSDSFDDNPQQFETRSNSMLFKELTVNTTYYFRVKAVDKSGNESDWNADDPPVSASTVKIDNENYLDYLAVKNMIIHNGQIDTAWISELDAAVITTGILKGTNNTTEFDLDNDLISIDNGNVKIGKDAISNGVHGILVQNGNIKLQGANSITTIDLTEDKITVGSNVIIGKDALGTGRNGILVNNGDIQITGGVLTGANGTTEIDLDNDKITVGTDLVKIGKEVATKFVDKIEILVDITGGGLEPDAHVYASLDNSNWIDLGLTFDLEGNRIQINLFNYVAYGQTIYLKVEVTGEGTEDGDIDVYVDDTLFDTYHYDVDTDYNPSQVFTITLPDEKNDGIEINGGVINSPIINVTTESGELRLIDSGWGIKDGGSLQDGEIITRSINFENVHTNGLIIFRSITSGDISHGIIRIDTTNETKFEIDTFHDDEDSIYSASLTFYSMEVFNCALSFRNKVVKVIGDGIAVPTSLYPPSNPEDGQIYYNKNEQKFYGYAGSRGWVVLG